MRFFILLLLPFLPAAGEKGFHVLDFGNRGRITQKTYDDLDGDGKKEVLLFSGKRVSVFRPDKKGGYDLRSPIVLDLDPEALYFDVGQVDGDEKTNELVLVSPAGVLYHSFRDGKLAGEPRLLIPARSLVSRGQPDDIHWRGFLRDLDRDGDVDIILATRKGYGIYYQEKAGRWPKKPDRLIPYTLRTAVRLDPPGLAGRIRGTVGVPDFLLKDFTGDGKPDLALDDGRRLTIFAAGKDGRFAEIADRVLDLSPLLDPDGRLPPLRIRDVNGDGRPDFLLSHQRRGITDVFLSEESLTKPALRIKITGWAFEPRLTDLDGDGHVDLIVPSTPEVGFMTAMSVAMTGAISVRNHIFLNTGDPERPFAKTPTVQRDIRVNIRLFVDLTGNIRSRHSVLVNYGGDFDGDGRKDLLYREGTDEILLFPGEEEEVFASSASREVEIPDTEGYASVESVITELDGDGRPDVALFYLSPDRTGDRLVLLLSNGK